MHSEGAYNVRCNIRGFHLIERGPPRPVRRIRWIDPNTIVLNHKGYADETDSYTLPAFGDRSQ